MTLSGKTLGEHRTLRMSAFYALVAVIAALWFFPVILIVITSFKSNADFYVGSIFSIPRVLHFENFQEAWRVGRMSQYFKNSVLVCLIKIPIGLVLNSMAAFGLAKMRFRFERPFFVFFLLGMMLPIHVALVPLTILLNKTHMLDTLWAVIIPYIGFYIPFSVFLLRGYFRTIPPELDDAARIDGCSDFVRYWRIILPLALPVLATLIILDFLGSWNEFLMALLFLRTDQHRTLPLGLMNYRDRYVSRYNLIASGVLISAGPVTLVYLIFQRYFIKGVTAGSLKG